MRQAAELERIVQALLYEGYLLYPYRRTAAKNQVRWPFGVLYPREWTAVHGDRSSLKMEFLALADDGGELELEIRFLQLLRRSGPGRGPWEEAVERSVTVGGLRMSELRVGPWRQEFEFQAEPTSDATGGWVRGCVAVWGLEVGEGLTRLTVEVTNTAALEELTRPEALLCSLVSAHVIAQVSHGRFVSLTDPPEQLRDHAAACQSDGVWAVLAGDPERSDTMLGSPIIVSDYPVVAPESGGDLFDATEIDEILTLRILTLTDAEKAEMRESDEKARLLLQQAEGLSGDHLMRLHGAIRSLEPVRPPGAGWDAWEQAPPVEMVAIGGVEVRRGDRVRLRPSRRADILDIAMDGKIALVEAIERDFENHVHLAVVLEEDPGRDLGEQRQTGHRFFFAPAEVEPLSAGAGERGGP